jgi:hypothetical protein
MSSTRRISASLAVAALIAAALIASSAAAQTVFRSTDSQGNVHFSDTPPPPGSGKQTETVTIPPLNTVPVPSDVQERMQRSQQSQPAGAPNPSGQAGVRDAEIAAARKAVADAEAALAEAKVTRDDDWQRLVSGRRVLAERYFDRVAEAEARLELAQTELRRASGGR